MLIRNKTKADQVAAEVQSANFKSVLPKVSKLKKFFLIKITVKLANWCNQQIWIIHVLSLFEQICLNLKKDTEMTMNTTGVFNLPTFSSVICCEEMSKLILICYLVKWSCYTAEIIIIIYNGFNCNLYSFLVDLFQSFV